MFGIDLVVIDIIQLKGSTRRLDCQETLYIVANPVFHECTKSIKLYCHIIRENLQAGLIKPLYVPTRLQLGDVLAKALVKDQFVALCNKLGLHDIYSPT